MPRYVATYRDACPLTFIAIEIQAPNQRLALAEFLGRMSALPDNIVLSRVRVEEVPERDTSAPVAVSNVVPFRDKAARA